METLVSVTSFYFIQYNYTAVIFAVHIAHNIPEAYRYMRAHTAVLSIKEVKAKSCLTIYPKYMLGIILVSLSCSPLFFFLFRKRKKKNFLEPLFSFANTRRKHKELSTQNQRKKMVRREQQKNSTIMLLLLFLLLLLFRHPSETNLPMKLGCFKRPNRKNVYFSLALCRSFCI